MDLGNPAGVADVTLVVFGFDIVRMFFAVAVVVEAALVRASTGTVRATASDFFMVSAPFPVVPFGSVIYNQPIRVYLLCYCRLLVRYCRNNHLSTPFDPMVETANFRRISTSRNPVELLPDKKEKSTTAKNISRHV